MGRKIQNACDVVVTTIKDINLLQTLLTTEGVIEHEWLCKNYGKCNAQILPRETFVSNINYVTLPKCRMYFSAFKKRKKKTCNKCKLFIVAKIHKLSFCTHT
jgi:hypothetical protein